MEFAFGVKTGDLETARQWVELATGLASTAKEHADMGGLYYRFCAADGELVELISNFDVYDLKPFVDGLEDWKVLLFVQDASETSATASALMRDAEHFALVEKK